MRTIRLKHAWPGALIAVFFLFAFFAAGQEAESTIPGVPAAALSAALQELRERSGAEVKDVAAAHAVCDQERFLVDCAEIGKKYGLFEAGEIKSVDLVLNELKGKVVEDLKQCTDEACLVEVANRLARGLAAKNLSVANALDLTPKKVDEKKTIVEAAREVGVTVRECQNMDPDEAPVEMLRACVRLAKNKNVERFIPAEARHLAEATETAASLKEALGRGEYACGDGTLDGCGNYCLNPSAQTRTEGASSIPPVCRDIAAKFFGSEGIAHLEEAYSHVRKTEDFYKTRAENVVFNTHDGKTLTDPVAIGRYLENEGGKGNVEAVERGMDFMIAKGFVGAGDKEFALGMIRKIKEQGTAIDFNACRTNPAACAQFVPEGHREDFGAFQEIERIMRGEMQKRGVADPLQCESNRELGASCAEAANAALPQIEEVAKKFPAAAGIVREIREKISFAGKGVEARKAVEEKFFKAGESITIGERSFRDFGELENFCRQNGQLCLAETARHGVIEKDFAAEQYGRSFEIQFRQQGAPPPFTGTFPGQPGSAGESRFPNFQSGLPGQGQYSPNFQGQPGRLPEGYSKEEALKRFQAWLDNPQGAPPIPHFEPPRPATSDQTRPPICPALATVDSCPAGQVKVVSYSSPECGTYYSCQQAGTYPPPSGACPQGQYWNGSACMTSTYPPPLQTCPQGQYWNGSACVTSTYPPPSGSCPSDVLVLLGEGCHFMYTDSTGNQVYCDGPMTKSARRGDAQAQQGCSLSGGGGINGGACPSGQYWFAPTSGGAGYCKPYDSGTGGGATGVCTSELISLLGSGCHSMGNAWFDSGMTRYVLPGTNTVKECSAAFISNCTTGGSQTCPSGQYWNGSTCVSGTTPPPPSGGTYCHTYVTQSSCVGTATCVWYQDHYDGTHCDDVAHGQGTGGSTALCSDGRDNDGDGQIDYPADTGCYGPSDNTEDVPSCPSGQHWDGTACSTSTSGGTCPSFAHDMSGYCMLNNDTSRCAAYSNAASEGNYTTSACTSGGTNPPPPSYTSCPSGQYWNGSACVTSTYPPPSSGCPSGQYWNGTACTTSATPPPSYYTPPPSYTTCSSGQYWDGSACVTSTYPPPSQTCSSGQYWNGTSCVSDTHTTTPPPSYTPPPTYTPPPSYTPPPAEPPPTYTPPPPSEPPPPTVSFFRRRCPLNHSWNGSYCVVRPQYTAHLMAQVITSFGNLADMMRNLFR